MSRETLRAIEEAVAAHASATDEPCIVTSILVIYETASIDGDGDEMSSITYTSPSGPMSATLGLAVAGLEQVRSDILGADGEDE